MRANFFHLGCLAIKLHRAKKQRKKPCFSCHTLDIGESIWYKVNPCLRGWNNLFVVRQKRTTEQIFIFYKLETSRD